MEARSVGEEVEGPGEEGVVKVGEEEVVEVKEVEEVDEEPKLAEVSLLKSCCRASMSRLAGGGLAVPEV